MTVRGPSASVAAVGLLVACTGGPAAPADHAPASASWWRQLASDPASFDALMADGRDGWVALHANDYRAAHGHFVDDASVPAARAAMEQARLHADLALLVAHANTLRQKALSARGVEVGELGATFSTWGAHCGPGPGDAEWEGVPQPLNTRRALHRRVIGGDPDALDALYDAVQRPVVTESEEGFERQHVDPCADAVLTAGWWRLATRQGSPTSGSDWQGTLRDAGLAGSLFAPFAQVDDATPKKPLASTDLVIGDGQPRSQGGTGPDVLWAMPSGVDVSFAGDTQAVRDAVVAWSQWTDAEAAAAREAATAEGAALLDGLDPVGAYRQDVLVAAAREALRQDRSHQALVMLESALDVTERKVGTSNPPELYALLAEARLKTGRTRQALDALEPLTARVPTVASAKELVGDLAVLQSMDRVGDSKEN